MKGWKMISINIQSKLLLIAILTTQVLGQFDDFDEPTQDPPLPTLPQAVLDGLTSIDPEAYVDTLAESTTQFPDEFNQNTHEPPTFDDLTDDSFDLSNPVTDSSPILPPLDSLNITCYRCESDSNSCVMLAGEQCQNPIEILYGNLEGCSVECNPSSPGGIGDPVLVNVPASTLVPSVDVVEQGPPPMTYWYCDQGDSGECFESVPGAPSPPPGSGVITFNQKEDCSSTCLPSSEGGAAIAPPIVSPPVPCWFCNAATGECEPDQGNICSAPADSGVLSFPSQLSCVASCSQQQPVVNATPTTCPDNEIYQECGSSCPPLCKAKPAPEACTTNCVPGCFCQSGLVRDPITKACLTTQECQESLAGSNEDSGKLVTCAFCNDTATSAGVCTAAEGDACNPGLDLVQPWATMENCQASCGTAPTCYNDEFKCNDGSCIADWKACDGVKHCPDAEDELRPECENADRCVKNAEFRVCAKPCEPTCEEPGPAPCPRKCEPRCTCNTGYVRDYRGYCILPSECDDEESTTVGIDTVVIAGTANVPRPTFAPSIDAETVTKVVSISRGETRYWCPDKECKECVLPDCVQDVALWDSPDMCAKNCPPTPDCFHCDGENCGPAYGLACYPPDAEVTSVFQQMDTCVKWCGKVGFQACELPNEVYDDCGSTCPGTCENRGEARCSSECVPGCYCLQDTFRDTNTGECVKLEDCPHTNKTFYCDKFSTIVCLLSLAEIPSKLPDLSIQALQKMALEENEQQLDEICAMFKEYETCAAREAEKQQCTINGPLDRLAQTSGQMICDPKMIDVIRRNADCLALLDDNADYKKCSDKFGNVINLENLDELISGDVDKTCQIVDGLSVFEPCASRVVAEVCKPEAKEMTDYLHMRVQEFAVKNACGAGSQEPAAEPEPEPTVVGVVNADPAQRDPNMFTTTGCLEEESDAVEQCFVPLYGLKNQSLGVFGKGIHKLKENIEKVIVWSCEKFEMNTKPCLLEMQDKTESCKVYSCLLHSVRTGCAERKNLDKHWGCLFTMITDDRVINCLGGLLAQNNEATDWSVVIPELIQCVDAPIREGCGDKTMDFIATLSVSIASPPDNGNCEVTKEFLQAYTFVKSAEVEEPTTPEPGFGTTEATEGTTLASKPEISSSLEGSGGAAPSTIPPTLPPVTTPEVIVTEPPTTTTTPLVKTTPVKVTKPSDFAVTFAQNDPKGTASGSGIVPAGLLWVLGVATSWTVINLVIMNV